MFHDKTTADTWKEADVVAKSAFYADATSVRLVNNAHCHAEFFHFAKYYVGWPQIYVTTVFTFIGFQNGRWLNGLKRFELLQSKFLFRPTATRCSWGLYYLRNYPTSLVRRQTYNQEINNCQQKPLVNKYIERPYIVVLLFVWLFVYVIITNVSFYEWCNMSLSDNATNAAQSTTFIAYLNR